MDPVFQVDTTGVDGQLLVRFLGELDLAGITQAHDQVVEVLDQAPGPLILELGRLTYTDSSGIHVLLSLQSETRLRGRGMILRSVQPAVAKVLEIAGVRDQFVIED
jgi:anti-sigma B factor antagonist